MKIIVILFLILFPASVFALETLVSQTVIESKDLLPSPYSCIEYSGRNGSTVALYAIGCPGKKDGWMYYYENPNGDFVFQWEGETLFLRPYGAGKNQMRLYRRFP